MKKILFALICIAGVSLVQAQNIAVTANVGILTRGDFHFDPLFLSGNLTLDIFVGRFIMISPEFTAYSNSKFETASVTLAPGGTVNFTSGSFFIGAGFIKEIWLKSTTAAAIPLEMKLQVGINAAKYRIGAYMLTYFKDLFKETSFGFTIGFGM